MKAFKILVGVVAVVLASNAEVAVARAGDIGNAALAGLVLNNTIPDNDFYALTLFAGLSPSNTLSTTSTDTTAGFSQSLSGTYLGQALSVSYVGSSTAFPGGAITWTSTGNYGAETWSGNGSADFTFPTSNTFQVAYSSSLTIGANTVVTSATISGADNGTSLFYTGTTGTLTADGGSMPAPVYGMGVPLNPIVGDPDVDDLSIGGVTIINSQTLIVDVTDLPALQIADDGDLSSFPEPSSHVLAGIGILSVLIGYAWRQWIRPA